MTTANSSKSEGRRAPPAILAKLEELKNSMESGLEKPGEALELLVSSVAKGLEPTEVFETLHRAAQQFDQLFDLAFSYEHVAGDMRVKLLAPEQQAYLLLQAAAFVGDVLGHAKEAVQYAERALHAVPGNELACERLERLLGDEESRARLTAVYLDASRRVTDPGRKLALSSRAVELAFELPAESELALEVLEGQLELDPRAEVEREELVNRYSSNGRRADAIRLLERGLELSDGAQARSLREQLVALYVEEAQPDAAIGHVEAMLALDPEHATALRVAEGLVEHRVAGARAAAALSHAYDASGRVESAIEMLSLELKRVRGSRRVEVQRRLGVLRQDVLGDRSGALALLGPVVAGDPGDDELRRRFIELSLSLDQPQQAARLLARALSSSKDPGVRTRVGADVGAVFLKTGDVRRAQAAFEQALEIGADPGALLHAARELAELYAEGGDTVRLAGALELVVRNEPEREARQAAARRLARLCEADHPGEARAIVAYRALFDSPWSEEALERLEQLCEKLDDHAGLADALEYRAAHALEREEGRELLLQAALKRTERTSDRPAALATWRRLLGEYGPDPDVLARVIPLLEQAGEHSELARVLGQQLELTAPVERPPLFARLGQLCLVELADPGAAVEAFERALEIDPEERTSRAALDRLLSEPSVALRAAAALERVYRSEPPRSSLVRILAVRGAQSESVAERLAALREGADLCAGPVRDFEQGLRLSAMGISLSLEAAPEQLEAWLDRFQTLGEQSGQTELRAKLLEETLGERAVDSKSIFELARATGEALASAGQVDRALEVLRRAVVFDPAPEVVQRIDELLAQQGSPEERFALYQSALAQEARPERRREFLHAMAALQARQFGDLPAAIATWQHALSEDPGDVAARQALVDAYEKAGDPASAHAELERLLDQVGGDRRTAALLRMAELCERLGDDARALAHYRELFGYADVGADVLERAERLARKAGDAETVVGVLERALEGAGEPALRVDLLERLGEAHAELRADVKTAEDVWLAAARLAEGAAADRLAAHRLYARIHAVSPEPWRAGARLFELSAELGDWATVEAVFHRLAGERNHDVVALLLSIVEHPSSSEGIAAFARMVDRARPGAAEPGAERQLLSAKARAVANDPERLEEAAALYEALLESGGTHARTDAEAFEALLATRPATEVVSHLRWLYQWQVDQATDPSVVLGNWAQAEAQRFGAPERAAALYEKLLARDSDRVDAYLELARLRAAMGDEAGAVEAFSAVRARSEGEARASVELKIARLLLGALQRPGEALDLVASLLEAAPGDRETLALARDALNVPEARARAVQILERTAAATEEQGPRTEILEALLEATRGTDQEDLVAARRRWLKELLDTERDDPAEALRVALRAVEEEPSDLGLWDAAERFARGLDRPDPVAEAYARVLDGPLDAELGESLGRRTVEFFEEWFDDAERVVRLLERVLALSPGAAWAFDRLKLAFNAAGRWRELFDLYDRQLRVLEADLKVEVLREAAMAAKDFANDAARAIEYLERLDELTPEDARIETALERLYEREGRPRSLIELYVRQLGRADATLAADLHGRIARLWLELAEPLPALAVLETMLEVDPDSPTAVELLEALVLTPEARESMVPGSEAPSRGKARKKRTPQQSVKERAAGHLGVFYRRHERVEDVVRMLEIEVETAATDDDRLRRLREVTKVRLEELGDAIGAFENVSMLVRLVPAVARHRAELAELAERTEQQGRRCELLVTVADEASDPELQASLLSEAARTCRDELRSPDVAIELYLRVLRLAGDDSPQALDAARAVAPLLAVAGRWETCCAVLERLAVLEAATDARCEAWRDAAEIAFGRLGDADRAAHNFRRRLSEMPGDRVALDGLVQALDRGERWTDLVRALDERASTQSSLEEKRADLVRVARTQVEKRGDPDAAVAAWRGVRELDPADDESFGALKTLLSEGRRWSELAELLRDFAGIKSDPERRAELLAELGEVHRSRTGDRLSALRAFVEARRWDRAIEVAGSAHSDRALAQSVCAELLELAFAAWTVESDSEQSAPAQAAGWALGELSQRLLEEGRHAEVVELLLRGSEWPFSRRKRRELLREAACLCSDRIGDVPRAIELFTRLFAEDRADEVAAASVTRLSLLFEEQGRHEEVVSLWEGQAQCRAAAGDRAGAAALWARAGELSEERLGDESRAVSDYRYGAGLGGESSLEALARIHTAAGDWVRAAQVLEWLCAQSAREALGSRTLRLAEAYLALGEPEKARARLESAAETALEAAPVRARLAELYREAERFTELARLLAEEAQRATDARKRLELLKEAARLHQEERDDPAAAVPLLRDALVLAPDEAALRMKLAMALTAAGSFDQAAAALFEQVERYGQRRPKERAIVHFELAKVLLRGDRADAALEQLELANKIDPAHPAILSMLARRAFEAGELPRAEQMYRALLLVAGRGTEASRAEALLDLSEIATRRGDGARAAEFIESAFEAALESVHEAEALERALRAAGRPELLTRAIELRLNQALSPAEAARVLADLVMLQAGGSPSALEPAEVRRRVDALRSELDARYDDDAWAALGRIYDWLGDPDAEAEVLERRVAALDADPGKLKDAEPFYRLAVVRLSDPETLVRGYELVERALQVRADVDRAYEMTRRALADHGPDPGGL
ncbi:MAG TPA: tetratricopeptide repeat protein, partial [Polyangiaceae bacterium]